MDLLKDLLIFAAFLLVALPFAAAVIKIYFNYRMEFEIERSVFYTDVITEIAKMIKTNKEKKNGTQN